MITNVIPHPAQPIRPDQEPDQNMPAQNSDPVPAASRPVREVQAVCSKHTILCGAPDSLEHFMRALQGDKHLAMDFWSLVARLSDQGHAADTDWLLATIVEGVTSQSVADVRAASPPQRELVARLEKMLAGHDDPAQPAEPAEPARPLLPPRSARVAQAFISATEKQDRDSPQSSPLMPPPFTPAITRPRLVLWPEEAPESVPAGHNKPNPEPALPLRNTAPTDAEPALPQRNAARVDDEPTLSLRNSVTAQSANLAADDSEEPEPHIVVPLAGYADDAERTPFRSGRLFVALVVLVLAAAGFALFRFTSPYNWQRAYDAGRGQFTAVAAIFQHHPAAPSATSNPAVNSGAQTFPGANTVPGTPLPAQPAASAQSAAPAPPPAATPQPNIQPPASPKTAPAASANTPSIPAAGTETLQREVSQPETADAAPSVDVPGSQMRQYLISSRIPIYPQGAHGTVVVRVIITSRGTVQPLNIVSGNPELRQAALDAVSTWRYRPYLLNGVPVDVSTTIDVNSTGYD